MLMLGFHQLVHQPRRGRKPHASLCRHVAPASCRLERRRVIAEKWRPEGRRYSRIRRRGRRRDRSGLKPPLQQDSAARPAPRQKKWRPEGRRYSRIRRRGRHRDRRSGGLKAAATLGFGGEDGAATEEEAARGP